MFSSFFAQAQRTRVVCWFLVMASLISLHANSSLLLWRRDKPRLLPDKMMRSWNRAPAVRGIGGSGIPGNDRSSPNGRKQRENLLPSRRIRSNETRLFLVRNLHDDPHAREMCPVSVQARPDITHGRSWRNPHGATLSRNDPRLIGPVSYHII